MGGVKGKRYGGRQSTLPPRAEWTDLPRAAAEAKAMKVPPKFFYTGVPCSRGHIVPRYVCNGTCVGCSAQDAAEHLDRTRPEREAKKEANRLQREAEAPAREEAKRLKDEAERPAKLAAQRESRRTRMREEGTELVREEERIDSWESYWRDPVKARARIAERRARGLVSSIYAKFDSVFDLRRPPWQTSEERAAVEAFYDACPEGHTVDHIVPFVHPLISGLHVLTNLQYLTKSQNPSKGNRIEISQQDADALVAAGAAVWTSDTDGGRVLRWNKYRELHPISPAVDWEKFPRLRRGT